MQADQDDFDEPDLDSDFEYEESSKKKKKGRGAAAASKSASKVRILKFPQSSHFDLMDRFILTDTDHERPEEADPDELRRHGHGEALLVRK